MRSSSKSTQSKKDKDPKTTIEVWFVLLVIFWSEVLFSYLLDRQYPKTAIGYDGLKQVTEYLEKWFYYGFVKAAVNSGVILLTGWFDNRFENRHEKIKPKFKPVLSKYMAIAASVLTLIYSFCFSSCKFDVQIEKNGYRGMKVSKVADLLSDCQLDLKERKKASANIKLGNIDRKQYIEGYSSSGSVSRITEYSICDTDHVIVSQISRFDSNTLNDHFSGYLKHEVEQFVHSGFVASIDGLESDIPSDYQQLFTIEVKGDKIVRNTTDFEGELKNFCYVCEYKGKTVWQICADRSTEYPISTYKGAEYYLECYTNKGYTRISNKLVIT